MKRINRNLISDYCKLRGRIDKLKEIEKEQRARVLDEFERVGAADVLPGHDGHEVRKVVSKLYKIRPADFMKRVKLADFLACCTVSRTRAADYMARADVEDISDESEKTSLKVNV